MLELSMQKWGEAERSMLHRMCMLRCPSIHICVHGANMTCAACKSECITAEYQIDEFYSSEGDECSRGLEGNWE